jgi:hypothetical protein
MLFGAETWPMKRQTKKLEVAEIKNLSWLCGLTKHDRIRNEKIRGTAKVVEIPQKYNRKDYSGMTIR